MDKDSPAPAPIRAYASGPGVDNSVQGRIVAFAIRCHAGFRIGDREFDGDVSMHEVVALRAFYEALQGGSVTLRPEWPPGHTRMVSLDQKQLEIELARMVDNYRIPQANNVLEIVPQFFGADHSTQLRTLHSVMVRMVDAWNALMKEALTRVPKEKRNSDPNILQAQAAAYITEHELTAIANIADPSAGIESDLVLPEAVDLPSSAMPTPDELQRQVDTEPVKDDAELALLKRLTGIGLTEQQGLEVALAVEMVGEEGVKDEALVKIVGEKKLSAVRRVLKAG